MRKPLRTPGAAGGSWDWPACVLKGCRPAGRVLSGRCSQGSGPRGGNLGARERAGNWEERATRQRSCLCKRRDRIRYQRVLQGVRVCARECVHACVCARECMHVCVLECVRTCVCVRECVCACLSACVHYVHRVCSSIFAGWFGLSRGLLPAAPAHNCKFALSTLTTRAEARHWSFKCS